MLIEPEEWNEWENKEDIPESLAKKWQEDERKGLRAGVCKRCGYTFGQDELSCPHCEMPVEIKEGVFPSLKWFFTRSPMGIMIFILIFLAIFLLLIRCAMAADKSDSQLNTEEPAYHTTFPEAPGMIFDVPQDTRVVKIGAGIQLESPSHYLSRKIKAQDRRVDVIDQKLEKIEERLDTLDQRIKKIEASTQATASTPAEKEKQSAINNSYE